MEAPSKMSSGALHGALLSLEDDSASLSRRFRATHELRRLLADLVDGDPVACRICYGRRAPSLLVAMMDEFGEDRDATRNDILACLASLVRFVPGEELASDPRLWALLMRMMYQRDNESVLHALTAVLHMGSQAECLKTLRAARRMPAILRELRASPHAEVAATAERVFELLPGEAAAYAPVVAEAPAAAPGRRRRVTNMDTTKNRSLVGEEGGADGVEGGSRESMIADLMSWRAQMSSKLEDRIRKRGSKRDSASGTATDEGTDEDKDAAAPVEDDMSNLRETTKEAEQRKGLRSGLKNVGQKLSRPFTSSRSRGASTELVEPGADGLVGNSSCSPSASGEFAYTSGEFGGLVAAGGRSASSGEEAVEEATDAEAAGALLERQPSEQGSEHSNPLGFECSDDDEPGAGAGEYGDTGGGGGVTPPEYSFHVAEPNDFDGADADDEGGDIFHDSLDSQTSAASASLTQLAVSSHEQPTTLEHGPIHAAQKTRESDAGVDAGGAYGEQSASEARRQRRRAKQRAEELREPFGYGYAAPDQPLVYEPQPSLYGAAPDVPVHYGEPAPLADPSELRRQRRAARAQMASTM